MIAARFDGECPSCEGPIYEGDKIGLLDGEWCCEQCVEDAGPDGEDRPGD